VREEEGRGGRGEREGRGRRALDMSDAAVSYSLITLHIIVLEHTVHCIFFS